METRVLVVTSAKAAHRRRPVVRLQGNWLAEIGFVYGKLVTAEYTPGKIVIRLQDSGNYKDLVKGALKSSSGLAQVNWKNNNKRKYPRIEFNGFWLEKIGFTIGNVFAVRYEFGLMKLLLIDLDKLEA